MVKSVDWPISLQAVTNDSTELSAQPELQAIELHFSHLNRSQCDFHYSFYHRCVRTSNEHFPMLAERNRMLDHFSVDPNVPQASIGYYNRHVDWIMLYLQVNWIHRINQLNEIFFFIPLNGAIFTPLNETIFIPYG